MKLEIKNIDQLIKAFEADKINTKQLLYIMDKAFPKNIAIWTDENGYNGAKEETLKSLESYKKYLESGNEIPLFFFNGATEPTKEFSFNDCLNFKE